MNFGPEVWVSGLNNTRAQPNGANGRDSSKSKKNGPPKLSTTLSRKFSAAASSIFHPEDSGAESGNESANDSDNESPIAPPSQTKSALPHIRSPDRSAKGHHHSSSASSSHSNSSRASPVEANLSNMSLGRNSNSSSTSQPGSATVMSPMGMPGKKNILYKIFHPNDENSALFGRSRRSYQSGSEDESGVPTTTDESDAESDCYEDSVASSSMSRPGSAMSSEASPRSSISDDSREDLGKKNKSRSGRPSIFKDLLPRNSTSKKSASSSQDTSDSEDSDEEEHSNNVKDLFKGLIRKTTAKNHHHHDEPGSATHKDVPGIKLDRPASPAATPTTIAQVQRSGSETSLSEKYGKKEEVLGKGANAVVRLCCPVNSDKKFAIKEFRKRRKDESQKEYVKKLVSEFCISSSLEHSNVVKTVDLIQDDKKQWCVVMEYVAGGDLYSRIHSGTLTESAEIFCYFKQLVNGVKYLHNMGVAHRDLKPENLLLDMDGKTLKITDFGVSEVFRTPFGNARKKARGLCGSGPYIAPEEFESKEYDAEEVDVWSIGIIYYVMAFQSIPWRGAVLSDSRYKYYVEHHNHFWPFDRLIPGVRKLIYKILEPDPEKRITIDGILADEWFKNVCCCVEKREGKVDHTHSNGLDGRESRASVTEDKKERDR